MDEGLLEQVQVANREPDPGYEGFGRSHDAVVRPPRVSR
jgi:hypothetical protein